MPSLACRTAWFPVVLTGSLMPVGEPTAANVAGVTEVTAERTPAGSADVPLPEAEVAPAADNLEAATGAADPEVVLMITMVARAAMTKPTGASLKSME